MEKLTIAGAILLLSLTSLFALPHRTFAQSASDPQSVVNAFYAASNSYDVDTEAALFASDAVITLVPPPPPPEQGMYKGIDQIKPWLQYTAQEHTQIQLGTLQVSGNKVTSVNKIATDDWAHLGVSPLQATDEFVVQDGKITSLTSTLTSDSVAKLQAAFAGGGAPGMPKTGEQSSFNYLWALAGAALALGSGTALRLRFRLRRKVGTA